MLICFVLVGLVIDGFLLFCLGFVDLGVRWCWWVNCLLWCCLNCVACFVLIWFVICLFAFGLLG